MSITSFSFLVFFGLLLIVYYALPRKTQWITLLCASCVFYLLGGLQNAFYILITSFSVYACTCVMQKHTDQRKAYMKANKTTLSREEKNEVKARDKQIRKRFMILCLLLNFGILCVFKYLHFIVEQINPLLAAVWGSPVNNLPELIIPLGISFYTFQSMGYCIDVYWENVRAEKNYFKVLLFVSFFPQIIQGPISNFQQLSTQLFSEHEYRYRNFSYGCQRMIWGFFKKIVIADILSVYVADIFANYGSYMGITALLGGFMYSVQIYADFSGYMDIMCGLCETLGIRMTENFERPYFSKSIAEYWRRWHITLGAWFKSYIYYPIAMSKRTIAIAKKAKTHFGKSIPATIALVAVWLITGLWHGASWAYIAWGGVNGLFIIVSMWLEPVYENTRNRLRIRDDAVWLRWFRTIRTFFLVTVIKVLPEVGTLSDGIGLWVRAFTEHSLPHGTPLQMLEQLIPTANGPENIIGHVLTNLAGNMLLVSFGVGVMLTVSLIQRRGSVRDWLQRRPRVLRWGIFVVLACIIIVTKSFSGLSGGFLYARF